MVGRPSLRDESGREALLEGREWSRVPQYRLGVVVRPYCRAGSGREALQEGREWMGGPPGGMNVVESPSWTVKRPSSIARSGLESNPKGRE